MRYFYLTLLLIFLACTNPFSTRDPQEPKITSSAQAVNSLQNHPDSLFSKIKYAFSEKNVNFYLECIADEEQLKAEFQFIPHQNEAYRLIGWTTQDEANYFNRLVNNKDVERVNVQFYNVESWTLLGSSQDTMQTRFSYEILLNLKSKREFYKGQSIFKILRSQQSLWYLFFWEDFQLGSNASDSTWSTLKANFR